jgi:prepilin-type N-terminal cleavage/methylation domain-containing protein
MKQRNEQGVSLIEVLVAIAIFGVMMGGVFTAVSQGNYLVNTSAELLQARLLANKTMETLKTRAFEDLESATFSEKTPQGIMSVDVVVSEFHSNTLKKIDVSVQWVDNRKQSRILALSTLRSSYSLGNN